MKRAHICGLAAVFLSFASLAVAAPLNLEPFESQCRDEIMAAQCPEGHNCYQLWKPIVHCAFTRAFDGRVSSSALDACIRHVDDARRQAQLCTACSDRDIDQQVLACLSE